MANPPTEDSMGLSKLGKNHLLKMKLDLSFLYALYWQYLFNRCMIIKHWVKIMSNYQKR